jgi:hypothetical protein
VIGKGGVVKRYDSDVKKIGKESGEKDKGRSGSELSIKKVID